MRPPNFWFAKTHSFFSLLMEPISWSYGLVHKSRYKRTKPWSAPIPVICIGNLLVGGQGKTPVAISIGQFLTNKGIKIHFLSRGYGGVIKGPIRVNLSKHTSNDVGDEPLLLAQECETWVSSNRALGIQSAYQGGAEVIITDDGFQDPSINKDLSIIVIDGEVGFGNGRLLPSGPLRENIYFGLSRAQAVVIIGNDHFNIKEKLNEFLSNQQNNTLKIFEATIIPKTNIEKLKNKRLYAFSGIGRPKKFFDTLERIGSCVIAKINFKDHHQFSQREVKNLVKSAKKQEALLVTTSKDYARLSNDQKKHVTEILVKIKWKNINDLKILLEKYLR